MILGVGIDILDNNRVKILHEKYGDRFLKKVFTKDEADYCLSHDNPHQYLAARLAVKEAVSKAFGYGIGRKFQWKEIEVVKSSGKPDVVFRGGALKTFSRMECECSISLSHEKNMSVAIAILESWE